MPATTVAGAPIAFSAAAFCEALDAATGRSASGTLAAATDADAADPSPVCTWVLPSRMLLHEPIADTAKGLLLVDVDEETSQIDASSVVASPMRRIQHRSMHTMPGMALLQARVEAAAHGIPAPSEETVCVCAGSDGRKVGSATPSSGSFLGAADAACRAAYYAGTQLVLLLASNGAP